MAYQQRRGQNHIIDVVVAENATPQFSWRDRLVGSINCMLEASA